MGFYYRKLNSKIWLFVAVIQLFIIALVYHMTILSIGHQEIMVIDSDSDNYSYLKKDNNHNNNNNNTNTQIQLPTFSSSSSSLLSSSSNSSSSSSNTSDLSETSNKSSFSSLNYSYHSSSLDSKDPETPQTPHAEIKSPIHQTLRIAIVMVVPDSEIDIVARETVMNKREYADRHGYRLIVGKVLDEKRTPHWAKIMTLFNALNAFPEMYVFYFLLLKQPFFLD